MKIRLYIKILALLTIFATVSTPFPLDFPPPFKGLAVKANTSDAKKAQAQRLRQQGIQQLDAGQYQAAIQSLQQALPIYRELLDGEGEDDVLFGLVRAYEQLGDRKKANEYRQQRVILARDIGGDSLKQLALIRELADNYYCDENLADSISTYQEGLQLARKVQNKELQARLLIGMGKSLVKSGDFPRAEQTLRDAIPAWEVVRAEARQRQGRDFDEGIDKINRQFFELQSDLYFPLQQALIGQNKPEAALEIAEQGRAKAFAELLAKRLSPINNANHQSQFSSITLDGIKQIAREQNATLVEYTVINNDGLTCQTKLHTLELLIWVIKPTGEITFRRLDINSVLNSKQIYLSEMISTSRESIGVRGRGLTVQARTDETEQTNQLKLLNQLLIEPIAEQLPKEPNSRVIFIPQDALFLVPFSALQDASGKYLIEKNTVITAPSIKILELTRQAKQRLSPAFKEVLIVGNPTMPSITNSINKPPEQLASLPGAEREAKAVAALLNAQPLIGDRATTAAVMEQMPKAKLIHLATHGLLDATGSFIIIPGAIALAKLANSNQPIHVQFGNNSEAFYQNNGLLTSDQIMDFQLNAELVVLSACDTGRGDITNDGVAGLSRAFISAGVPSVIVSLWSVPDAPTEFLMTEFYRNFKQNPDKAQALRQAMLSTKEKHPDPKNWAAFTLIGEAD